MIGSLWRGVCWYGLWIVGVAAFCLAMSLSAIAAAPALLVCLVMGVALVIEWATRGTVPADSVSESDYVEAREAGILKACDEYQWPEDVSPWHPLYVAPPPLSDLPQGNSGFLKLWGRDGRLHWLDPVRVAGYVKQPNGAVLLTFYSGQSKRYFLTPGDARRYV